MGVKLFRNIKGTLIKGWAINIINISSTLLTDTHKRRFFEVVRQPYD